MRYLLIILAALLSCNTPKDQINKVDTVYVDREIPVYIEVEIDTDSLLSVISRQQHEKDSMKGRIDTYARELLRSKASIQQAKKYFRIVHTKEDQLKFIRGWMSRVPD